MVELDLLLELLVVVVELDLLAELVTVGLDLPSVLVVVVDVLSVVVGLRLMGVLLYCRLPTSTLTGEASRASMLFGG